MPIYLSTQICSPMKNYKTKEILNKCRNTHQLFHLLMSSQQFDRLTNYGLVEFALRVDRISPKCHPNDTNTGDHEVASTLERPSQHFYHHTNTLIRIIFAIKISAAGSSNLRSTSPLLLLSSHALY